MTAFIIFKTFSIIDNDCPELIKSDLAIETFLERFNHPYNGSHGNNKRVNRTNYIIDHEFIFSMKEIKVKDDYSSPMGKIIASSGLTKQTTMYIVVFERDEDAIQFKLAFTDCVEYPMDLL